MGVGCRSRTSGNPVACIQRNDRTSLASKLPWPDGGLALGAEGSPTAWQQHHSCLAPSEAS
jgi:hypothetical protein